MSNQITNTHQTTRARSYPICSAVLGTVNSLKGVAIRSTTPRTILHVVRCRALMPFLCASRMAILLSPVHSTRLRFPSMRYTSVPDSNRNHTRPSRRGPRRSLIAGVASRLSAGLAILWTAAAVGFGQAPSAPQPGTPPVRTQFHEPAPIDFNDHAGFTQIFDGQSLADWEGDPAVWRVENGAIVGESSKENVVYNPYIWRKNLVAKDFF